MNTIDEQALRIFTAKSQADKAINSLKGILLGINMDNEVSPAEVNELQKWAQVHNHLIKRAPFNELMATIEQMVTNSIPKIETIEDLFWLCQKYEGDNYYYNAVTTDLQTLQGLCHGILSDGILKEKEIVDLNEWLLKNEHLSNHYPYDELRSLIMSILSDNKVDEEEKLVLKAFFKEFVKLEDEKINAQINEETAGVSISGLCTSEPNVTFENKTFCVTGKLQRYERKEVQDKIKKLGGIPVDSVTMKTDYLIVGDSGNPAWAFSCYGRKVEKAITMRKEGHTIMIIHEYDFADILDDLI